MDAEHSEELISNRDQAIQPSWELREELGFWRAFSATQHEFFADPAGMFRRMPAEGDLLGPILFTIVNKAIVMLFYAAVCAFITYMAIYINGRFLFGADEIIRFAGRFVLSPFLTPIRGLLTAAFAHLILCLVSRKRFAYTATARAVLYATGGSMFLCLIPCAGFVLFWPWLLFTAASGLSSVHGVSFRLSAFAMLISLAGMLFYRYAEVIALEYLYTQAMRM